MIIVGYGIGNNYQKNKENFKYNDIKLDYLCDARWEKFGNIYDGIPVISPHILQQMKNIQVIVMVIEQKAFIEITHFLENAEIPYKSLEAVLLKKKQNNIVRLVNQSIRQNILNAIYEALQDSESKILFDARLRMSIYGDPGELYKALLNLPRTEASMPVSEPYYCKADRDLLGTVRRLLTYQDTINRKRVVLCRTSRESYSWVKALNLKLDAILEEDNGKQDYFPEYLKINIEMAINQYSDAVFISGDCFDGEIKGKLISQGIPPQYFKMRHTCWKSQYFDETFIKLKDHEVFVDAGVLDLNNTFDFLHLCKGKCDKVYALEPDKYSYENCVKRLEQTEQSTKEKIKLFHAAAWSKDTKLSFVNSGVGNSHLADDGIAAVEARSIDSILQGNRVTYIKMDIEGAELEALKGASESIKKWRPRLAICIYHKPEDIIELPSYILSLVPDYKMYIRHYSTCIAETVLYCL